jgi:hypothetical protein
MRHVGKMQRLGGQQAGAEDRQRRVLGTGNGDFAEAACRPESTAYPRACAPFVGVIVFIDRACNSPLSKYGAAAALTICWRCTRLLPTNCELTISAFEMLPSPSTLQAFAGQAVGDDLLDCSGFIMIQDLNL